MKRYILYAVNINCIIKLNYKKRSRIYSIKIQIHTHHQNPVPASSSCHPFLCLETLAVVGTPVRAGVWGALIPRNRDPHRWRQPAPLSMQPVSLLSPLLISTSRAHFPTLKCIERETVMRFHDKAK